MNSSRHFPYSIHSRHRTARRGAAWETRARGFSLVTTLFALVVFSVLAAAMVSLFGMQTQSANLALLEARVYAAAQLGADYGSYQAVRCVYGTGNSLAPVTRLLTNTVFNGLGITIQINITWKDYVENKLNYHLYTVTSDAVYGSYGQPEYVARRIRIFGTDNQAIIGTPNSGGCQPP